MKKTMIAIALLAMTASFAQAVTFEGSTAGIFGTPDPSGGVTYTGVGTNVFTSGQDADGNGPNSLTYDGVNFSVSDEDPFLVGELTYYNGVTVQGTNVDTVPIDIELTFTSPFSDSFTFTYTFDLEITVNSTGDPVLDADTLVILPQDVTETFNYDGTEYTLQILGFSMDGGATIEDTFILPENDTVMSGLYGKITSEFEPIIPEPATMALLGLGLAGFGVIRRRR